MLAEVPQSVGPERAVEPLVWAPEWVESESVQRVESVLVQQGRGEQRPGALLAKEPQAVSVALTAHWQDAEGEGD